MTNQPDKNIPEYLVQIEGSKRYRCTMCDETISSLFADLGCDCEGKGRSKTFKDISNQISELIIRSQKELTSDEQREIKDMVEGEL